ncbi:hypothetical protein H0R92_03290 [Treponema sp. OMZ 840]|uniref:tetratricopeptide repeat protein n=1 Tax=Treponema sp. OMZ 840 TaxID=244313 RepID=UPI003D8EACB9
MRKSVFVLRHFFIFAYLCVVAVHVFSQNPEQYTKTALRYIDSAKKLLIREEYEKASSQAALGLVYDDTIADLYYIQALSMSVRGLPAYMIEPLLTAALQNRWYDYNRDAARLLLADLYTKTAKPAAAVLLLDEMPVLSGKDALYTRAKALYLLGDVQEARLVVKRAAFQFPEDERFAVLFFDCENAAFSNDEANSNNKLVFDELLSLFLSRIRVLQDADPDILLKASAFGFSADEKKRLLRSWNAYGKTDPLYAVYALQAGLLSEEKAFDYMFPFLNQTIDYTHLRAFVSLITDERLKERLRNFYAVFAGTICFDTNNDGIADIKTRYRLGRPFIIEYDKEQDGRLDWVADCDYGIPVKLELCNEKINVWYGEWPSIARIIYEDTKESYDIRDNTLFGTPVNIIKDTVMEKYGGTVLYVPVLQDDLKDFSKEHIFSLSHTIERKSNEYAHGSVRFSLFEGRIQNATYTDRGTPYAYGHFENGILRFRNVDWDKNGSYEVTEIYGFDIEKAPEYRSPTEAVRLSMNLFGTENDAKGLYLYKTLSDTDGDGIHELIQEYGPGLRQSAVWKRRNKGEWDIRWTRYDEKFEEIEYQSPFSGNTVTVRLENGKPVSVNGQPVTKDPAAPFFWIGEYPGNFYAEMMIQMLNRKGGSGVIVTVSDLLWVKEKDRFIRIFAVKNGNTCFGEVLYE